MRRAVSKSAAALESHNAADPVEVNKVCRIKLKVPYQTDSDIALLPDLNYQLGPTLMCLQCLDQASCLLIMIINKHIGNHCFKGGLNLVKICFAFLQQ